MMRHPMESAACLNCGNELAGRWCSQCGQRVTPARPTLHELAHEAVHELGHLDGKIVRSVKLLLFRPGERPREFLDGKRVRAVSPIRLYLICSLIFFASMSLVPTRNLHLTVTNASDAQLNRAAERVNKDPQILIRAF